MNNQTTVNSPTTYTPSQSSLDAYPYVHVSIEKQTHTDENLLEALYVAGMPRTLYNRLDSSFSRRLND